MAGRRTSSGSAIEPRSALASAGARLVLAGPLLMVAGGRWASYIGFPGFPIYLTDITFVLGAVLLFLGNSRNGPPGLPTHPSLRRASALAVLAGLIGVLLAGDPALAVRDAVPIVYLALVPVYCLAARIVGAPLVVRAWGLALAFHTVWAVPAVWGVLPELAIGGVFQQPIFSIRGDVDVLLIGVALVATFLWSRANLSVRFWALVLLIPSLVVQGSRAGALGALVAAAVAFLTHPATTSKRRTSFLVGATLGLPLIVISMWPFLTNPPTWASALVKVNENLSETSSANTTDARLQAWGLIWDYNSLHGLRFFLGNGFGSSFVMDSGALRFLSGDPSVRQAHNIFVTWFGQIGLVGATLLVLYLVAVAGFIQGQSRSPVKSLGAAVCLGIVVAASVGVILESPFGYLIFSLGVATAGLSHTGPSIMAPAAHPATRAELKSSGRGGGASRRT